MTDMDRQLAEAKWQIEKYQENGRVTPELVEALETAFAVTEKYATRKGIK